MGYKEIIAEIKAKVGEDALPKIAQNLAELEQEASQLQAELNTKSTSVNSLYAESKTRKERIQDLELQMGQLRSELDKAKNNDELETFKKQNEELKKFQEQVYGQNRTELKDRFNKIKEHPSFEKVKDVFSIPIKEGTEEFDFQSLEDAAVSSALEKINEYTRIGLFEAQNSQGTPPAVPKVPGKQPTGLYEVNGRQYTKQELANAYPEKYAEIRKEIMEKKFD